MANPLVECIPNFSEGRNPAVIDQIASAITSIKGVQVLDRHSDSDHNRSVLTVVGEPEALSQAIFLGIQKAAELIDMTVQQGEHPRIGATDVVPFVPISGISMADCVILAKKLGKRVGEELDIPVYLYEAAASMPERTNLEDIRRGEYEGLRQEIETNPQRKPDFGPGKLGKAGATVIGAREALIAFNIYLCTDEVAIAKKIARSVRFSSGGLRYVKAMGVLVEGRAQVSMNLTNYLKTPIAEVVESVRREALRYGTAIHHSELVGLIPQAALVDAAVWYTQMDQFESDQVLENRLHQAVEKKGSTSPFAFLEELASAQPTPGGGSAAAFTAAEAAALVAMVARLTIGKKKYASVEGEMIRLVEEAEELRAALTAAILRDAAAFDQLMAAYRLPKDTDDQAEKRDEAVKDATFLAAEVPLETVRSALAVIKLALVAVRSGNINAITDAGSAAALALAAISSGGANVRINLQNYPEEKKTQEMLADLEEIDPQSQALATEVRKEIKERAGIAML